MSKTKKKSWDIGVLALVGLGLLSIVAGRQASGQAQNAVWHHVPNWPQLPPGQSFGTFSGVAVDKNRIVYVFERNELGDIWMFHESGKYLGKWGPSGTPGFVKTAHTIHIDPSGFLWITDRTGHQIKKYTPEGRLLMTIGTGQLGSGADQFNGPANIQFLQNGEILVSDGYWNSRVVWFDKDGRFLRSIGSQRPIRNMDGRGPGSFGLVHAAVQVPNGRVLVSDRCDGPVGPADETRRNPDCQDNRIQVVEQDGKFVAFWNQFRGPLCLFVVGSKLYTAEGGRILILDANTGRELDAINGAQGAHQIAVDDAEENVYVAVAGRGGRIQRFTRVK